MTTEITTVNWITFSFSLGSLIISVLTAGWTIRRDLADNGRLLIQPGIRKIIQAGIPGALQDQNNYLIIGIVNTGRRAIRADRVIFVLKRHFFAKPQYLLQVGDKMNAIPKMLEPYETVEVLSDEYDALLADYKHLSDVHVMDPTGKIWRAGWKRTRKLKKEMHLIFDVKGQKIKQPRKAYDDDE